MPRFLYPEFFSRDDQWRAASAYWRDLVAQAALAAGVRAPWRSWHPTTFADGVTQIPREFSPVYEARCDAIGRAVYVEQSTPEDNAREGSVAAWIRPNLRFPEDAPPTNELVLNVVLSEDSARISRPLLERWMDRSVSREAMEEVIHHLIGTVP